MKPIDIPVIATGPGSQPGEGDGATLDYLSMPNGMATYAPPPLPEPEEVAALSAGLGLLESLQRVLSKYRVGKSSEIVDLCGLNPANREWVDQSLGEGEVSVLYRGPQSVRSQETRLARVWRARYRDDNGRSTRDAVEVADIPDLVRVAAFRNACEQVDLGGEPPEGVLNAPSVLAELNHKVGSYRPGCDAHVIDLTLLPQTEQDLAYLDERLGVGPVLILSRGYGNCRVTATTLKHVWWVQHFNSEDKLILNTLEIVDVPTAALAAILDALFDPRLAAVTISEPVVINEVSSQRELSRRDLLRAALFRSGE